MGEPVKKREPAKITGSDQTLYWTPVHHPQSSDQPAAFFQSSPASKTFTTREKVLASLGVFAGFLPILFALFDAHAEIRVAHNRLDSQRVFFVEKLDDQRGRIKELEDYLTRNRFATQHEVDGEMKSMVARINDFQNVMQSFPFMTTDQYNTANDRLSDRIERLEDRMIGPMPNAVRK